MTEIVVSQARAWQFQAVIDDDRRTSIKSDQRPSRDGGSGPMIRKTMRIGEIRTSIKLEAEFWDYLKAVADERGTRPSALVNEVARAHPERTNLASTLRTFSLSHALLRVRSL